MSPQESARANIQRLSSEANALKSYLLAFVTQADINRIGRTSPACAPCWP